MMDRTAIARIIDPTSFTLLDALASAGGAWPHSAEAQKVADERTQEALAKADQIIAGMVEGCAGAVEALPWHDNRGGNFDDTKEDCAAAIRALYERKDGQ